MININKFEGKKEEDVLNQAMIKLNCEKDNLIYKTEVVEGKLFKSSKYVLTVVQKSEIKSYIQEYFKNLSKLLNICIDLEVLIHEDNFNITLVSDNNAILIGKDGKNLNAIQTLLRQSLRVKTTAPIKVNIDVNNYKIKKLKNLEREIKVILKEVLATKVDASLDPMNSYERRYIHNLVNEYKNLETESVGEGKERHIIIKYVEN